MISETEIQKRTDLIFVSRLSYIQRKTDRVFAVLFILQWVFAIVLALTASPRTWVVDQPYWHIHLWAALWIGGLLTVAPILCAYLRPGKQSTRYVIAVAQVGYSTLLIHLTGGRIETHFHVFGSLAFLSFYRDWRVFVPATLVVAADHILRGLFWPESVFGVLTAAPWRAFEHAGWVVFEDVFLVWGCLTSRRELREMAQAQVRLEISKETVEQQVEQRTSELAAKAAELSSSIEKGHKLELQLLEAQKLESIGQLAAGIAHEINTPMQYVSDNVEFLSECSQKLFEVVAIYHRNLHDTQPPRPWAERIQEVEDAHQRCRFDYIRKQAPLAIQESKEGVQRVIEIVRAMKQLSHPGSEEKVSTNINEAIRSTVTVTKNRWKYAADVELYLADNLPDVKTLTAGINQVLLNLVVNAADAIVEKHGENGSKGKIVIRTRGAGDEVVIEVQDDGCGMPEEVRRKIFDPFFTTKEVGKGTGQGLAISFNVIVNHHGGALDVQTEPGKGTTFLIRLPTRPPELQDAPLEPAGEATDGAAAESTLIV